MIQLLALVLALVAGVADVTALAAAKLASYREPPYGACRFVEDVFHATPDPWQEELLKAWVDPSKPRISLQACVGPGKTCGTAWCAWHFLATRVSRDEQDGFHYPRGLATSVTSINLRDNLWAELAHWQGRSSWLLREFAWTSHRIFHRQHEANWFLGARAWQKTASAEQQGKTFSGLHGRNIAVLIDESGTIPPTILRAGEQALVGAEFAKMLQSGNPTSLEGMLYDAAVPRRAQWHVIRITGDPDDLKAWVHNPRAVAAHTGAPECLCATCWARQQIKAYGRDNPWVMAHILGQFPPNSINTLLGYEEVEQAMARIIRAEDYLSQQKRLGVDVARFGDDRTVLFARQGLNAKVARNNPHVMRGADTNEIVARVMMANERWRQELTLVDNSFAWGNGVVDNLMAAGLDVHPVNFAGKPANKRYKNRRAEMWIRMRDAVRRGAALPQIDELIAELTTPTYTFVDGAFQLEEKDMVKKRLGRSPDLADALALTYALPEMPANVREFTGRRAAADRRGGGRAETDYDPLAEV